MQFFYGNEPDMFTFFKIPKLLFSEPYKGISTDAKLLFGLMLDRMSLSAKGEHWIDPDGRVFIYFRAEEVMEILNIGKNKALNLYKELETSKLIQRERQPFGKPAKIYVCKFFKNAAQTQRNSSPENQTSTGLENKPLWFENQTSTGLENKPLPFVETENNETDFNETENIFPPNPPEGGTGESFPVSHESVNSTGTGKGRRQRREQSAPLKSELSPEEEEELSAMSPRLRDAVRDWMADKAQRRNPYTPTSKRALIGMVQRNVGQYGADIVAQTIEESTANGYSGIAWSRAAQLKGGQGRRGRESPYTSRHVDENGHYRYNPGDTTGSF